MSETRPTNRLAGATSPYLLQHAHNPVDWYPWGEEALARARAEDKPILLSIGYSACHWCHVMERESFENDEIAALMNRSFVCIKVDREERPDLDDVYMAATLALNHGQGGWPMTVFLTPEQEPFFAGTYFPPDDRYGRPGFPRLLERIAEAWTGDRARLREQGAELVAHLRQGNAAAPGGGVGADQLRKAASQLSADFDERFGGFGSAPKFPPSGALMLLLRAHRRFGDERALAMVRKTLDEMARGGMYDQLAGGFHRYSVDERWLAPHFEKMLYDNALLARAYLEAHQVTADPFYARIAREVLDYVRREMTAPEGGFHSATDADSEGEEGRYFVWTPEQLAEVLGEEDARVFGAYYDVDSRGNWEGHSILNTSRTGPAVAQRLSLAADDLEARIAPLRARLLEARARRVPPALDDKVLTAWNGLMISAFAEGARVLGEPKYLESAVAAARFVLGTLRRADGGLLRSFRAGRAGIDAFLEDYAYLGDALVDAYEAGGPQDLLDQALALAERIRRDFGAEDGGFHSTAEASEPLVMRHREGHDGAIPSANAKAALLLARLGAHFGRDDLRQDAERALRAYGKAIARQPRAFAWSLMAADFLLEGPVELAFVGDAPALRAAVAARFLPNRVIAHQDGGVSSHPLLAGKTAVKGLPALYVCRNFSCRAPITEPGALDAALSGWSEDAPAVESIGPAAIAGHATAAGTTAFADRHRARLPHGFAPLGRSGLTVSRIGFGGYRVDDETAAHRMALVHALRSGCNLIDTSTNYTDGGSERLVGEVVREGVADGWLRREELVVVTKVGYVQGANLDLAQQREEEGRPFPEMVKYAEGIWHCIHPEFLRDQIARSRERLGLATIDVVLLHNPEYFLKDEHERSHGTLDKRRQEFDARLRAAFACLEEEVAAGRLRAYGVSSNSVTAAADDPEATSLEGMLAAARRAGGDAHHFEVLQLPLNLVESGAVRERNQAERTRTVLDVAQAERVAVLVNRPLNAFASSGLVRLADSAAPGPPVEWKAQVERVADLESEFRESIAAHLQTAEGGLQPAQFFRWAEELPSLDAHVRSLDHWDQMEGQRIVPRVSAVLNALDQGLEGPIAEEWQAWRGRYLPELRALLGAARARASARSAEAVRTVRSAMEPALPSRREAPLSQLALWTLTSTPGVSCVLVGMRREAYVDDALTVLGWPALADAAAVYERTAVLAKE